MNDSVHRLLEHALDYAGLFPPARLPMAEAFTAYRRYRSSPEAWFLGRFVVPASRLHELESAVGTASLDERFPLSLIGQRSSTPSGLVTALAEDADLLRRVVSRQARRLSVDQIETRLPDPLFVSQSPSAITDAAQTAIGRLPPLGSDMTVFFETTLLDDWQQRLPAAIEGLAAVRGAGAVTAGLKIRCGGLTADSFPSTEAIATAIDSATRSRLRIKATQGLHHPIRHPDTALNVWRHGFLNVLFASVLAFTHEASLSTIIGILEETDASRFECSADGISCHGLSADVEQIRAARAGAVVAYGSCSFSEPIHDLHALGLVPAPSDQGGTA
jgi:hypothetical protein